MRTVFLKLFILLYILSSNFSTVYGENFEITSYNKEITPKMELIDENVTLDILGESAILMDASTGEILYEKNMNEQLYPASITKLMTVLLAFEYGNLDDTVVFSESAIFGIERNSSHIALDVGEELTLEQCLYAILLQSANEASLGVAEHIGGSKEGFADMMNKKAKELGCLNTHFVNPNGLHDNNHYTSAYDMALIAKEVLKYDKFRDIIKTIRYEIPPTNIQPETRYLYAQHQMIKPPSIYVYDGCLGGKTGFTNEALNTLVTYAKKGDTTLIAVVLKDSGANTYVDTKTLFDYGFANYKTVEALPSSTVDTTATITQEYKNKSFDVGNINISNGQAVYDTIKISDSTPSYTEKINLYENIKPTINEGDVVGTVDVYKDNTFVGSSTLNATEKLDDFTDEELSEKYNDRIKDTIFKILKYIVIAIVIIFLILIILRIIVVRRRRKKQRRFMQKRNRFDRM